MNVTSKGIRLVVLILVHTNIRQVIRLIGSIRHPGVVIYLHADQKCQFDLDQIPADVHLVQQRELVTWRSYSQVKAILNSLKEIVDREADADYISLVSGQDYPILPMEEILEELTRKAGKEFIHIRPLDPSGWNSARVRFERFYFESYRNPLIRRVGGLLTYVADKLRWKRKFHRGMKPFGGSAWWTLSRPCIVYILDYLKKNRSFVRFMKKTIHADEMLFQSVIMNSSFASRVENDNLRHIEWIRGHPNPNILIGADFDRIVASGKHFARKFDTKVDEEVLNRIDRYRANRLASRNQVR